jgi:hypothetical protein
VTTTYGLEQLKSQIVVDHGRHHIPDVFRALVGTTISAEQLAHYTEELRSQGLEGVREAIAHSEEAYLALDVLYKDVWGLTQSLERDLYKHYVFLLSTGDWTLAEVRADMEEIYFQTAIVPVLLITITTFLQ